jgi:hypothetical protein
MFAVAIPFTSVANSLQIEDTKGQKNFSLADSNKKKHLGLSVSLEGKPKMTYRQLFFKLLHHRCPLH